MYQNGIVYLKHIKTKVFMLLKKKSQLYEGKTILIRLKANKLSKLQIYTTAKIEFN